MWKKGNVGGRDRSSYAAPELRLLSSGAEMRFSDAVVAIDIDDLFLLWRDVRLSSSGFISGGSLVIFLNVTARYRETAKDAKCRPPPTAAK
jgi:hypothetical protein